MGENENIVKFKSIMDNNNKLALYVINTIYKKIMISLEELYGKFENMDEGVYKTNIQKIYNKFNKMLKEESIGFDYVLNSLATQLKIEIINDVDYEGCNKYNYLAQTYIKNFLNIDVRENTKTNLYFISFVNKRILINKSIFKVVYMGVSESKEEIVSNIIKKTKSNENITLFMIIVSANEDSNYELLIISDDIKCYEKFKNYSFKLFDKYKYEIIEEKTINEEVLLNCSKNKNLYIPNLDILKI